MAASLLGLGLFLTSASAALAQNGMTTAPVAGTMMRFTKEPMAQPASKVSEFVPIPKPAAAPTATFIPADQPATFPMGNIQAVAMQAPKGGDRVAPEENQEYFVQLEPPGPQRLFRLESERYLQVRMRQEALQLATPARLEFPQYKPLTEERGSPTRSWPCRTLDVEPAYVCYGRLNFEDLNVERYGWDLGLIAPLASALTFYKDVLLLPYHMGTDPCRHYECSAGYCLPGDPVPYLCYPPKWSLTGAVAEAGVVVGLAAIFP
ncbi:hypothetical protein AYO44_13085 [Planctomycetaceae bacterium SCGC AG-212-F19]|nr:hypothetical protein AYO44_13085 [Planctomycetaceae bacterium SCGC AG-212-F19]